MDTSLPEIQTIATRNFVEKKSILASYEEMHPFITLLDAPIRVLPREPWQDDEKEQDGTQ